MLNRINNEFDLLKNYLNIYIQLLSYCKELNGKRLNIIDLPSFEYYKNNINEFNQPNYKDSLSLNNDKIVTEYAKGLGYNYGFAYRYFNYYKGCKYFIYSINGDFIIDYYQVNNKLKCLIEKG